MEIEVHAINIDTLANFELFLNRLKHGGIDNKKVDLVLGCVDNFQVCISTFAPLLHENIYFFVFRRAIP